MLVDFGRCRRVVSKVDVTHHFRRELAQLIRTSKAICNQIGRKPDERGERHRFIEGRSLPVFMLATGNAGAHHMFVLHLCGSGARGPKAARLSGVLLHMPCLALTVRVPFVLSVSKYEGEKNEVTPMIC
jgi:hypothetical protein